MSYSHNDNATDIEIQKLTQKICATKKEIKDIKNEKLQEHKRILHEMCQDLDEQNQHLALLKSTIANILENMQKIIDEYETEKSIYIPTNKILVEIISERIKHYQNLFELRQREYAIVEKTKNILQQRYDRMNEKMLSLLDDEISHKHTVKCCLEGQRNVLKWQAQKN